MPNKVLLFSSAERAQDFQIKHANDFEYLGVKCTTPAFFMEELRDLSGMQAKLIDKNHRLAFLLGLMISSEGGPSNIETYGETEFLLQFIENVGMAPKYLERLDGIMNGEIECSVLEEEFYGLADEYYDFLDMDGEFVEASRFAFRTAEMFSGKYDIELVDRIDLKPYEFTMLNSISVTPLVNKPIDVAKSFEGTSFDLAVLTGAKAQYGAMKDEMSILKPGDRVLFVVKDPDVVYDQALSIANNSGIDAYIHAKIKKCVSDSYIGKAIVGLLTIEDELQDFNNLSDFARNPYLGLDESDYLEFDSLLRKKKFRSFAEIENYLSLKSKKNLKHLRNFAGFGDMDGDLSDVLIKRICKVASNKNINLPIEVGMIRTLHEVLEDYQSVCLSWEDIVYDTILNSAISVSCANKDPEKINKNSMPEIVISSPSEVQNLVSRSFDRVVCFDTSEQAYSIMEPKRAIDKTLFSLNLFKTMSEYDKTRNYFSMLPEMLKDKNEGLKLYFLLRDVTETEISVSFPMQELINSRYSNFDFEKITKSLDANGISYKAYGEDNIIQALGGTEEFCLGEGLQLKVDESGKVRINNILDYILTRVVDDEVVPVLSPSQIERYLQCPYKWFIENCIRPRTLDLEFDEAFIGSFVHDTFALIYNECVDKIETRFFPGDEEEIDRCVREAIAKNMEIYMEGSEKGKRLPDCDIQNIVKMRSVAEGMMDCLIELSQIPESFIVQDHELNINESFNAIFAGAAINGRIDRVDTDKRNSTFCIIDYKSSIGSAYDAKTGIKCDDGFIIPQHLQIYIYTKCMADILGAKPSAALYASFKKKANDSDRIRGIATDDFTKNCNYDLVERMNIDDFATYLEDLSEHVEPYIKSLISGDITPCPVRGACDYCKAEYCPARLRSRN